MITDRGPCCKFIHEGAIIDKIYDNCCGIDLHKKLIVACIRKGYKQKVREFGATTRELLELADWLKAGDCKMVAMESTASYWKPLYNILEYSDLNAMVVNARHMKAVPDRKTDVKDVEWIADLLWRSEMFGFTVIGRKNFMTDKKKEILICLFTGIASIFIFCIVVNIWNVDISIPFVYAGDLSGLLINIKTVLREESWWNFTGLGAPFHTNMWRQMMDAYIPNMLIFLFAKITQCVGFGVNFYYTLSYGLSGMCAYYMLRKSRIKPVFAVTGAILYAIIPGHFFRSEGHIYVGSCFTIPLIIVTAINLFEGKMCKLEYASKKKLAVKELLKSNSNQQNIGLIFLILVSLCTIYYGIFSLMLLTFCAVYCSVTQKQARHLYYYFQYVLIICACTAIIYLPSILANKFDPCIEKVNVITRIYGDTEYYAGKFILYILPASGHRIQYLADLKNFYNNSVPLINENESSSLGLIMSFGFLSGILACFFSKDKRFKTIEKYGKIVLFLFLTSTVGGLNAIVGMFNYSLRCYNRFSFIIGAVAIIISMIFVQELYFWLLNKICDKRFQRVIPYVLSALILIIGIFDQTTPLMVYTKEYGQNIKSQFTIDSKFVNNIEQIEGDDANILVFPVMNAQQAGTAFTKEGVCTNYKEHMLFIHANTSNWSIGSKAGEQGERWLNWLETFDEKTQAEIATIVGFSGIAICYDGYTEEKLNIILSDLNELLGEPILVNDNTTWAYYSTRKLYDKLIQIYTNNELEELKNKYLYDYNSWHMYNYSNLATTSNYKEDEKLITLTRDTCQCGPYSSFDAGLYTIETYGNNLINATFECCANGNAFEITMEECKEQYVRYSVSFSTDINNVEFRTFNFTDEIITVEKIEVTKQK